MCKEVAERWKVSFKVVVGREIFEQQAGSKGNSCSAGKDRRSLDKEGTAFCFALRPPESK